MPSNNAQLDLGLGRTLRDAGIARAAASADRKVKSWGDRAYSLLLSYPKHRFQVEDVRVWAHGIGLPEPPSSRAWGGVIQRAKKAGVVNFAGYESVSNPKAHGTPAAVWERTR